MAEKNDDDAYVIEDTGDSIEDIENEMEAAAQEADETMSRRTSPLAEDSSLSGAPPPSAAPADVPDELRKAHDRYIRAVADFDNYRKRADREKQEYFRQALGGLMKELLPVLDNFDRALDHAEEGDDFHKGVLLIYKQLWSVLQKHGLKPVEQAGVPFDPNIHEAVVSEANSSVPNHTVLAVLQKGYYLHDRLLRPAMVKVATGGPERAVGGVQ